MNSLLASRENLAMRGQLLRRLRGFFYERDFVEVETPLLAREVIPELHIEPLEVQGEFLQASPELHMKQLVCAKMQALFQVTRSFRAGERGPLHIPEFTIVEWYRAGDDMHAGMQLLDELCQSMLNTPTANRTTYAAAFELNVGINPHAASLEELAKCAADKGIGIDANMQACVNRDDWLNLLLASCVEPQLGSDGPEILYDYPVSQAALAKTAKRDYGEVAERFELYCNGVELANGYHELTDATELRRRLNGVNQQRESEARKALPMPETLLEAMEAGLPACAGCALGFDRLMMLACGAKSIREVRAFA